ncbi:MAG: hypothetical protein ACRDN0_10830 [Trebonia sp.]
MARPAGAQWQPLGLDSDPVPGDPGQISQEAQHLAAVAEQISSEVAMLRGIAASGEEVGKHAEKLRSSASDLADQLGKVIGRYQKVSSALGNWIPELEQAQSMSLQALDQAEGPYQQLHQEVALPSGHLSAQQKQQVQNYHNAMNKAQDQLNAAISLLNRATSLRDTQGSHYAGLINQACDDGVKDSWWDQFKDWVSEYAGIIKDICTVLEYIATILAIIALFIPGLDIIVILGIAATALALLGRTMLAATGNGSWMDVALDAFALLTFGMGKIVGSAMDSTFEAAEDVARTIRMAKIADSPLGSVAMKVADFAADLKGSSLIKGASGFLKDIGLAKAGDGLASGAAKFADFLDGASTSVMEHVAPSVEKTLGTVSHDIRPAEVALYGGEKESLLMSRNMDVLSKIYGDEPEFAQLADKFGRFLNVQRGIFGAATGVDQWDKWVGGFSWYGQGGEHPIASLNLPGTEFYNNFKESAVTEGGLSTGTADAIVYAAVPAVGAYHLATSALG